MSSAADSSLFCPEDLNSADPPPPPPPPPLEDSLIDSLIAAEPQHSPLPDYLLRCQRRSIHLTHRQDSIKWILHAHAHYHFQPVTALLSVNYFDRFLSSSSLPGNSGWEFQLLSVACLSLAAKMEETYVPLLLDLQVSDTDHPPRFLFEPKTVQRMELWVMSNLNWRLRSVTPFDFLHYFILKLPLSGRSPSPDDENDRLSHFHSACSDLILNTTRVIDFLGFPPSVIAAAAVISAAGDGVDVPENYYEKVNKEMVRSCHQLMEEYLLDTCPSADHNHNYYKNSKRRRSADAEPSSQPPPPQSPDGVLDAAACGSCDTRSDNPLHIFVSAPSASADLGNLSLADEPANKRLRPFVQEEQP